MQYQEVWIHTTSTVPTVTVYNLCIAPCHYSTSDFTPKINKSATPLTKLFRISVSMYYPHINLNGDPIYLHFVNVNFAVLYTWPCLDIGYYIIL